MNPLLSVCALIWMLHLASCSRDLTYELNPGCGDCEKNNTLLAHVQSSKTNSTTYHYLWAFITGHKPSFFLFETGPKSRLEVDWTKLGQSDSIGFTGSVHKALGIEVSDLFMNDRRKKETVLVFNFQIEEVEWNLNLIHNDFVRVELEFRNKKTKHLNGTVSFRFSAFNKNGRDGTIPHLLYTDSGSLMELTFNKIDYYEPKQNYTEVEVCANLTVCFEGHVTDNLEKQTSFSDEYTPGVFQVSPGLFWFVLVHSR